MTHTSHLGRRDEQEEGEVRPDTVPMDTERLSYTRLPTTANRTNSDVGTYDTRDRPHLGKDTRWYILGQLAMRSSVMSGKGGLPNSMRKSRHPSDQQSDGSDTALE